MESLNLNKQAEHILQRSTLANLSSEDKKRAIRFITTCISSPNFLMGLKTAAQEAELEALFKHDPRYSCFIDNKVLKSDLVTQIKKHMLSKK